MKEMYQNDEICRKCGGLCCKHLPGNAMPEDFGLPDTSGLEDALRSGKWALDCWDDITALWYVRPAATNAVGEIFDLSWGGQCVFLTHTGCELTHDDRPAGCRLLEPKEGDECPSHGASKLEAGVAWEKYHIYGIAKKIEEAKEA